MEIFGDATGFWITMAAIIIVYAVIETIQNR